MDITYLGKLIRFHRKKSGLSQIQLANMSGLGKTVIYDMEKGKLSIQINTLLKVFSVLNIKIEFSSPLMNLFEKEFNEKS